jgi:adenylosuccinate synthase
MSTTRPQHTAIVGLCWGDEGKGKVVDLLSPSFDLVIRFNGGANAGHTVCVDGETFALHLLPSGLLHETAIGVIGPGVALDPEVLVEEIDALAARGIRVDGRLKISNRAHIVADYHKVEDRLSEQGSEPGDKIGTTARGIGPCYADKMRRTTALRAGDLLDVERMTSRVGPIVESKRRTFRALFGEDGGVDAEAIAANLAGSAERLGAFICDTTTYLLQAIDDSRRLLFEGANGMLLDVDHGTYPFVTSSNTGPGGISAGAGVPPQLVGNYVGVTKAYATRVGSGPFPSELQDEIGDRIRDRGREYGTTTGRPRRCGWLDAVALRYSVRLGGITEVALTHLDTLSGLERIGICTGYRSGGQIHETMLADSAMLADVEPVVETHPGWHGDLRGCRAVEDLPVEASRYIERVASLIQTRITLVSVGPDRSQTLVRGAEASVFAPTATKSLS